MNYMKESTLWANKLHKFEKELIFGKDNSERYLESILDEEEEAGAQVVVAVIRSYCFQT